MSADLTPLIQGLVRAHAVSLDGCSEGLEAVCAGVKLDMRNDPAHHDQSGASHASYDARVVGRGKTGTRSLARARAAAATLNAAHVAPVETIAISSELAVIIDDPMDYAVDRETNNAGEKAVEGPTIAASGARFTRGAAAGSKRALGGG